MNKLNIQDIKIQDIVKSKYQTRLQNINLDPEIQELAKSIQDIGLLNPVTVKETKGNKFTLIAGFRRLEAYVMNKQEYITANIIKSETKDEIFINLAENIIRQNLEPLEIGLALHTIKIQYKLKNFELANIIKKSEKYIQNHLLLVNLHNKIKADIIDNHTKTDNKILVDLARIPEKYHKEQKNIYFQLKDEIIDNYEAQYLINKIKEKYNEIPKLENSENPIFQWNKNTFSINNLNIAEDKKEQMQNEILEIIEKYI